ncbi:MAG: hypothetical protein JSV36_08230 [Anaerolineae bacterium]|nr:MAG: hypothetical protein JSV36_08230 [Anaerolineae bacterium]
MQKQKAEKWYQTLPNLPGWFGLLLLVLLVLVVIVAVVDIAMLADAILKVTASSPAPMITLGALAPSPTPGSTAAPTLTPVPSPEPASISGRVWHDLYAVAGGEMGIPLTPSEGCVPSSDGGYRANGLLEAGEPGIGGVLVALGAGPCPAAGLATTTTSADGTFIFAGLTSGTYCVSVNASNEQNVPVFSLAHGPILPRIPPAQPSAWLLGN